MPYTINETLYKKGFSLTELIITLAIVGIISAIGLPVYRQIKPTLSLNSETRDITSDLRHAQQLAVTEQINYAIAFNSLLNTYTVTNAQTNEIIKSKTIGNNIAIQSITGLSADTVIFNVTGAATESGDIVLVNLKNTTKTILIKPSGYVKIQ